MDDTTLVSSFLHHAGFAPPAEEVTELERDYALIRQMVAALYSVEAARYESPALVFDPQPQFADWA